MSMVSYAAGTRYLSLLGGTCLSFYDWYCDLPPASPMTWGEQTDVPESADWYADMFAQVADAIVVVNLAHCETCKWQIEMSTSKRCEHPITLLAKALG